MRLRLVAATFVSLVSCNVLASQSRHKITFTFDYDFRITPACSAEVNKDCVKQFNFYDISVGIPKRVPLGSRPVPTDATGLVKGISFTTKRRLFKPGKHRVAVAAQLENGLESDLEKCAVVVKMQ
jgi:hypothetical protein